MEIDNKNECLCINLLIWSDAYINAETILKILEKNGSNWIFVCEFLI